jgi:glycerate kinase
MRVLVAPDKFKGTLTAREAANAIARGWRAGRPDDAVAQAPLADGGDGTLDALVSSLGGRTVDLAVEGPLGDPVTAAFGLVVRDGRTIAVVEMARASGLQLVSEARRDPMRASSFGTGQLIAAAGATSPDEVLVGLGGSATVDGGVGAVQALGISIEDERGRAVRRGGRGLAEIARIDATGLDPDLRRARVVAACDVDSVLTGPAGAAAAFGPQKGATPGDVVVLNRGLAHLAAVIERDLGIDVRALPGGGAAGGLGAGLAALVGARLRRGARVVMDLVGFDERLGEADLVVTGEGLVDATSWRGKVVGSVTEAARRAGRRVIVLSGDATGTPDGVELSTLVERFGRERAMERASDALAELASEAARACDR